MWFYIPAAIVIALLTFWISRTNLFRNRLRTHDPVHRAGSPSDPGSNAGVPGIQLPIALGASSKLPVGLELDGPSGSDRKLLAVGMAMEKIFGRLPPPSR